MRRDARIISVYAADTSGVCSALYELGGMTVVHDASGCNSTYSTHDEPRWYDTESMIYISGLSEIEAIMGDDEKLINDVASTAKELKPNFIALCGSPMPMMIGTDFDAVSAEIERRTDIPTLALHTKGIASYLEGENEALKLLAERFCIEKCELKSNKNINILGLTPLDFPLNGSAEDIKKWLEKNGYNVISSFAMGSSLEDIKNATGADVNLVVSYGGIKTAEYFEEKFCIPFVVGVPVGKEFSSSLLSQIEKAIKTKKSLYPCANHSGEESELGIVGEIVYAGSLACAIEMQFGIKTKVLCPLETNEKMLSTTDIKIPDEESTEKEFKALKSVIADPLYKPICPKNVKFYSLPHFAFSGRCFEKNIPNLINRKFEKVEEK